MPVSSTSTAPLSGSTTVKTTTVGKQIQKSQAVTSVSAASETKDARLLHAHNMPQVQSIDVACGKEKMTVRVTFDQEFNGVIYAKVSLFI